MGTVPFPTGGTFNAVTEFCNKFNFQKGSHANHWPATAVFLEPPGVLLGLERHEDSHPQSEKTRAGIDR
jgi:hypothetical protein